MLRTLQVALLALFMVAANAQEDQFKQQMQRLQQSLAQNNPPPGHTQTVTTTPIPTSTATPPTTTTTVTTTAPTPAAAAAAPAAITDTTTQTPAASAASGAAAATQNSPDVSLPVDSDLRDEAFSRVANSALPLTPTQIKLLRQLYDASQQAASVYPGIPPKPIITSAAVDLSPGATPPIIRLGAGYVTSLVFVDATGAPWPISAYSIGNPQAFNVQWDRSSNILLILQR